MLLPPVGIRGKDPVKDIPVDEVDTDGCVKELPEGEGWRRFVVDEGEIEVCKRLGEERVLG